MLVLASCQPPRVDGFVCDDSGRLAFALGETPGWLWSSPARPDSIAVSGDEAAWVTRAPSHTFIASLIGGGEPRRPVVVYGARLPGWRTATAATRLRAGERYSAQIWTDGGRAEFEWVQGAKLPTCPSAV